VDNDEDQQTRLATAILLRCRSSCFTGQLRDSRRKIPRRRMSDL